MAAAFKAKCLEFQSTLPAWGETTGALKGPILWAISIHSPRMGRDPTSSESAQEPCNFNPLSPHGERPLLPAASSAATTISIHSPRMGRDVRQRAARPERWYFNPLSPHGERPRPSGRWRRKASYFNPLSPHGERHLHLCAVPERAISIHSPRMGRDGTRIHGSGSSNLFQSTLPAWGETDLDKVPRLEQVISIHSPRMGRDQPSHDGSGMAAHFNPLSPHGERQQTHTTFRREKLAHLHNIVSFRQQRGSSC